MLIPQAASSIKISPGRAKRSAGFSVTKEVGQTIAEFRIVLRFDPNDPDACEIPVDAYDRGMFDAAIAEYREALRVKPNDSDIHINLGLALSDQGKSDEAIAEYREALRLKPQRLRGL